MLRERSQSKKATCCDMPTTWHCVKDKAMKAMKTSITVRDWEEISRWSKMGFRMVYFFSKILWWNSMMWSICQTHRHWQDGQWTLAPTVSFCEQEWGTTDFGIGKGWYVYPCVRVHVCVHWTQHVICLKIILVNNSEGVNSGFQSEASCVPHPICEPRDFTKEQHRVWWAQTTLNGHLNWWLGSLILSCWTEASCIPRSSRTNACFLTTSREGLLKLHFGHRKQAQLK